MQTHLKNLASYDESTRKRAVAELKKVGEPAFEQVAELFEHEVARWEVISLLPELSREKALPYLLKAVNKDREQSVQEREHAKKYFRIKAIEELGKIGENASREILVLFARLKIEDALGYFIHPAHPHLHEEVIEAVIKSLKQIATPTATKLILRWQNK